MAARPASQSQTAIVTGGSRGLGRGVVQALTARGVHVVALARGAESHSRSASMLDDSEDVSQYFARLRQ